jgi:transposase
VSQTTVGLDVGDRNTHLSACDGSKAVFARSVFSTTAAKLTQAMRAFPGAKVVLEAGSQSPWMSRLLRSLGHEVQVANPRCTALISKDPRKSDRRDADLLSTVGAALPDLLGHVHHRGEQAQAHLSIVRARDALVRMRTQAVQLVRSLCKAFGLRLPSASAESFAKRVAALLPDQLRPAIEPVLATVRELTLRIRAFERTLESVVETHYPEAQHLQQVNGVGPLTAIAFVLTVEDPKRFTSSRKVGSWLGLAPKSHASGDKKPQLRISKAGDKRLRRLLVQCAHYILGPFGKDCDLRRYGSKLAARGGKAAKKRAAVAVARKLGVLLHRLWLSGAAYDPLRNARRTAVPVTA